MAAAYVAVAGPGDAPDDLAIGGSYGTLSAIELALG
jgi:hypothetical protein